MVELLLAFFKLEIFSIGTHPNKSNRYIGYARADHITVFVRELKGLVASKYPDQSVYIVLDHAEQLRCMDSLILPSFMRLAELVRAE